MRYGFVLFCAVVHLAACDTMPPASMNFTLTPRIELIADARAIYPSAALLIPDAVRNYVWEGRSENMYGSATVKYFPLGTALEDASLQAYRQIFELVAVIGSPGEAGAADVVIEPTIEGHRIYGQGTGLLPPYRTTVQITTRVKLLARGQRLWNRVYASPLLTSAPYVGTAEMRTATTKTVAEALVHGVGAAASDMLTDAALGRRLASLREPPPEPARTGPPPAAARFPKTPLTLAFSRGAPRPDDVAVVIGNANYGKLGRDIPDVTPAYADAEAFKRYVVEALAAR